MSKDKYWEEQSKKFDEAAEYYDKYRPSYPDELINDLIEKANLNSECKILEIGAGSGKATELFVNKGLSLVCVEPGEELVKVGKRKFINDDVKYYNCRFENWEEELTDFDFIISAQAFHWVPQPKGYDKCSSLLKEEKKLAIFWNYYTSNDEDVDKDLKDLIKDYPIMYIATQENIKNRIDSTVKEIVEHGGFKTPEVLVYPWEQEYTTEEYLGFIRTGNGYLSLSDKEKMTVEKRVKNIVEKNGGIIKRPYTCVCYLAERA